jgi:nicotinic acid mononucleotide adenylyltransferase
MTENDSFLCDASTIAKVRQKMRAHRRDGKPLAFLVLSGSFNPVHNQHIASFHVARTEIEGRGYIVIAGFLAPSSDAHVEGKLSEPGPRLMERMTLCRLATEHGDWLHVCANAEFSSNTACRRIKSELQQGSADLSDDECIVGIEIMGSDTVVRLIPKVLAQMKTDDNVAWQRGRIVCCLLRGGSNSSSIRRQIETVLAPAVADWAIQLILIEPAYQFEGLESLSSTLIREHIAAGNWETLRSLGWLPEPVLNALRKTS